MAQVLVGEEEEGGVFNTYVTTTIRFKYCKKINKQMRSLLIH